LFFELRTARLTLPSLVSLSFLQAFSSSRTSLSLSPHTLPRPLFYLLAHQHSLPRRRINNSPAAIAHLLSTVGASVLVVAPAYQAIASEALPLLKEGVEVKLVPIAAGEVYSAKERARAEKMGLEWEWRISEEEEQDLPAFIVSFAFRISEEFLWGLERS